ncbi:MAG TPA: tRNA pseudouridine(55) synthase TruB [Anaerolineae bacterium]|nr:tRNA pseudouridine(55) synthase TruB [Anaerolineae bacterium]
MPDQQLHGILNINKPPGITSHDVVSRVRRITGQRRVGHAGTLDPLATGVLVLCLGEATRIIEYLMTDDKVYRARIRLGISTDTYDAEGQITHQTDPDHISRAQVEQGLVAFVGMLQQTPPMYSAIKHKGTPLYRLARRGQVVHRQARTVHVSALELLEWAPAELEIRVRCSKGTYIRSLAHDLGQDLGCGAHLVGLIREASGGFILERSITLDELAEAFAGGEGPGLLQPLDMALQALPAVTVDGAAARKIGFGQRVQLLEAPGTSMCRVYATDGRLLALLKHDSDGYWQPRKVFHAA